MVVEYILPNLNEIVYGRGLPMHLPYKMANSKFEMLDRTLIARELVLQYFKENL